MSPSGRPVAVKQSVLIGYARPFTFHYIATGQLLCRRQVRVMWAGSDSYVRMHEDDARKIGGVSCVNCEVKSRKRK